MYYQNDPKWKHKKLNNSAMTIGEVGCLLTALCNVYLEKNPDCPITPPDLNTLLIKNNGYTDNNLIIWSAVSEILDMEIQHMYTGEIEYDVNAFYIVNFLNFGVGHFTNLVKKEGDICYIYDVWNDTFRAIDKPRRLVKIDYR